MCVRGTREGTTYGKAYGISPVEASSGDGGKEKEERQELVSVYVRVCVLGRGQTISD